MEVESLREKIFLNGQLYKCLSHFKADSYHVQILKQLTVLIFFLLQTLIYTPLFEAPN